MDTQQLTRRPVIDCATGQRTWSTITPDGREVVIVQQAGVGTWSYPVDGVRYRPA